VATKKADPERVDTVSEEAAPDERYVQDTPTQWEAIERVFTYDEVTKLLESLPDQWGVRVADYQPYVAALPQNKKVKILPPGGGRPVEQYRNVYTLYMTVAGRQHMAREAQELHGWRVDY
jgi:hypothetical protein